MFFSQPDIIVAREKALQGAGGKARPPRKKAQTLRSGPVNPPLEEVEETTSGIKYLVTPWAISIDAMISV
jgi:hypothetical protein